MAYRLARNRFPGIHAVPLQLLAEGRSNKDIARMLDLSPYTVETYRSNLIEKLNVHGIAELMLYAIRKGVIA